MSTSASVSRHPSWSLPRQWWWYAGGTTAPILTTTLIGDTPLGAPTGTRSVLATVILAPLVRQGGQEPALKPVPEQPCMSAAARGARRAGNTGKVFGAGLPP
jgi:hypothetical protein